MHADQCVTGTAMHSQAVGRGQLLVDRLAYQCMGELVTACNFCVALNDAGLQGRLKPDQHFLHIFVCGGSDLTSRESTAIHGGDTKQSVATSRKSNQPSPNSLAHTGGDSCRRSGDSGSGALIDEKLDQLDGK